MADFAALADALAWPLVVLVLVFALRSDLRALLGRISRFKYGAAEVELAELRDLVGSEKARAVSSQQAESADGRYFDSRLTVLSESAKSSPRTAVLEAWIVLERSILAAATKRDLPKARSVMEALKYLISRQAIPAEYATTVEELRRIRNTAAHSPTFDLDPAAAEDFVSTAVNLAFLISLLAEPDHWTQR